MYANKGETDLIASRQPGIYASGRRLALKASPSGAALLVLSGQPINEPLVQYGTFVMNRSLRNILYTASSLVVRYRFHTHHGRTDLPSEIKAFR